MIDASAVRARSMEWLSFRYGATGELYYETGQAYYQRDPWTQGQWDFTGNGDGTLFYPGTARHIGGQTDIPVASVRLKMVREGMEDYEYLKLLSDLGGGDDAKAIAQELFPHAYQADAKPAELMAAREALARAILARAGKQAPAPGVSDLSAAQPGPGIGGDAVAGGCGSTGGAGLLWTVIAPAALALRRVRLRQGSR
jgi:hypothetical protein